LPFTEKQSWIPTRAEKREEAGGGSGCAMMPACRSSSPATASKPFSLSRAALLTWKLEGLQKPLYPNLWPWPPKKYHYLHKRPLSQLLHC
ncbi:hypothetical protein BAE44_0019095, partial [Dichanthelium oligosanthes]